MSNSEKKIQNSLHRHNDATMRERIVRGCRPPKRRYAIPKTRKTISFPFDIPICTHRTGGCGAIKKKILSISTSNLFRYRIISS